MNEWELQDLKQICRHPTYFPHAVQALGKLLKTAPWWIDCRIRITNQQLFEGQTSADCVFPACCCSLPMIACTTEVAHHSWPHSMLNLSVTRVDLCISLSCAGATTCAAFALETRWCLPAAFGFCVTRYRYGLLHMYTQADERSSRWSMGAHAKDESEEKRLIIYEVKTGATDKSGGEVSYLTHHGVYNCKSHHPRSASRKASLSTTDSIAGVKIALLVRC